MILGVVMGKDFVAVDVETANASLDSICQIGIAVYSDGALTDEWKSYIDPEDYFDEVNISIHGIDESRVAGQPNLTGVSAKILSYLSNQIVVCHTHFDRVAIGQGFDRYGLSSPVCTWLDSARVARRTWNQFSKKGYGLVNVCNFLGYDFEPHDALEDAKAAAFLLNAAMAEGSLDVDGWLSRVEQPIDPNASYASDLIKREGNPDGLLFGEVLLFTGTLSIHRTEAADIAAELGCRVIKNFTKEITILVVGDQDEWKLAGYTKSSKQRKAEALIEKGRQIRILGESDFKELAAQDR